MNEKSMGIYIKKEDEVVLIDSDNKIGTKEIMEVESMIEMHIQDPGVYDSYTMELELNEMFPDGVMVMNRKSAYDFKNWDMESYVQNLLEGMNTAVSKDVVGDICQELSDDNEFLQVLDGYIGEIIRRKITNKENS